MPKRHAARSISERGEQNLAKRAERERTVRGWSYETLARKMTDAGCAISKAALYSIEKGDPPRRITVDELVAFAAVFETEPSDLLLPVEVLARREAADLAERIGETRRNLYHNLEAMFWQSAALMQLTGSDDELDEFVASHVWSAMESDELQEESLLPDPIWEAWRGVVEAMTALLERGPSRG